MMQLRRAQWVFMVLAMGVVTALAQQSAPESPAASPTAEATAAPAAADATPAPDKSSTSRPVLGRAASALHLAGWRLI